MISAFRPKMLFNCCMNIDLYSPSKLEHEKFARYRLFGVFEFIKFKSELKIKRDLRILPKANWYRSRIFFPALMKPLIVSSVSTNAFPEYPVTICIGLFSFLY